MKYAFIIFLILLFFKSFYYGTFELKNKKNKLAGFGIYFLSVIGFLIPLTTIFLCY